MSNAHLLSVSSTGELALIMSPRFLDQRLYSGTLAPMTIGSSPRAISEDVHEADWSPDGSAMAIVHDLGNMRDRLEFPSGTVLHEASGYLSNPRVSPDGSRVAFVEHQLRFDDRGWVKVVDRVGNVTTLTEELFGVQGLAWASDGSSLVFSGNTTGSSMLQPIPCRHRGAQRPRRSLASLAGSSCSTSLAMDDGWRFERIFLWRARPRAEPGDRARSVVDWIDGSTCLVRGRRLAPDGRRRPARRQNYGVVLRKTDGSQAIRLGEGLAQKLSPDGKWAAAAVTAPAAPALSHWYGCADSDRHRADRERHFSRIVSGWETTARLRLGSLASAALLRRRSHGVHAGPGDA